MIRQVTIRRTLGCAFFLVLITAMALKAQENRQPETKIDLQENRKIESESQPASELTGVQKKEDRIFVPSEEISEDYAVPFPTDI